MLRGIEPITLNHEGKDIGHGHEEGFAVGIVLIIRTDAQGKNAQRVHPGNHGQPEMPTGPFRKIVRFWHRQRMRVACQVNRGVRLKPRPGEGGNEPQSVVELIPERFALQGDAQQVGDNLLGLPGLAGSAQRRALLAYGRRSNA
ncbi:MAG: hypothetical protein H7835_11775 [Magnetococcus sp. XQGC-1]